MPEMFAKYEYYVIFTSLNETFKTLRLKRLLPFLLVFLLFLPVLAQKRAMNWYFGRGAGISFSSGEATALSDGAQNGYESNVASISDFSGNLLFYTDGLKVYTANHDTMMNGNGIAGGALITQGSMIIPQPGVKDVYYLFTLRDTLSNAYNLKFSVIDMRLNNGAGAVSLVKNITLQAGVSERMAATLNNDGSGVWICVRSATDNQFHSFLLNANGISLNPISTTIGSTTSTAPGVQKGQMKFSPDGTYLAWACRSDRFVELLKFNKEDGSFQNWNRKVSYGGFNLPYGVEFSPNGKYLYVSLFNQGVYQYSMDMAVNVNLFVASQTKISGTTNQAYGLQLGPDHKIYVASYSNAIHVINEPNYVSCDFESNGVTITNGAFARDGFPNYISNYFIDTKIDAADTCIGDSTEFSFLMELGDSLLWDFGDQGSANNYSRAINPKHVFSQAGKFDIKLLVFNGEGADTFMSSVTINGLPQFTLGNDTVICGAGPYLLNPGVNNASYIWQDGKTTPVYAVKTTGTYTVRVDRYGCVSFDTAFVEINEPVTTIVMTSGMQCANNNAFNFTVNQSDRVASVLWNFGDGTTSTTRQTGYSYAAAGVYDVKLETINDKGCHAKDNIQIEVHDVIKATTTLNTSNQCLEGNSFELEFDDATNPGLKNYCFIFSDATKVMNAPAKHSFASAGDKWVSLITTSVHDCKDTSFFGLGVYANPEAKFTIDSTSHCAGNNRIVLNDVSTSFNGAIRQRVFESESFTGTGSQVVFYYPQEGTYAVKLRVEDSKGCTAEKTESLAIYPNPIAKFSFDQAGNCIGSTPIELNNSSVIAEGNIKTCHWDFGDGTESHDFSPVKQYTSANAYTIKLTTVSDKGCEATSSLPVETYEAPVADFESTLFEPCFNENLVALKNSSSIGDQSTLYYEWSVDGDLYTAQNIQPIHFNSYGPKLVNLKVTSANGCVAEKQMSFMILPSPTVSFVVNEPEQCENDNLFIARSTSDNQVSPIVNLNWELSDGRESSEKEFGFSFTESGVYAIKLTLKNQQGCMADLSTGVKVHPQPVANFSAGEVCLSTPYAFQSSSTVSEGNISEYWWSFGDKGTSTEKDPQHKFEEPGEFGVYLQVTSAEGCESFIVKKVNVLPEPHAEFSYKKFGYKTDLDETVYEFKAQENDPNAVITWYLNGDSATAGKFSYLSFSDTGHVEVMMMVKNGVGCPATSKRTVFVAPPFEYYLPTAFTPNGDGNNDIFKPVGDNYVLEYEMIIINRWGSVMYKTNDVNQGWDGRFQGEIAEVGTYVYIIRVKDIEEVEWKYEGTFVLINPGSF